MNRPEPAHLLWTSGWDSTFRLLELLVATDREVVPHYVIDSGRASLAMEITTMEAIVERVRHDLPDAARRLCPHRLVLATDIPPDPEVTRRYRVLKDRIGLGSQYDWLTRYAGTLEDATLELGVIHSVGKASRLLRGHLVTLDDGVRVLADDAPDELRLFEPFEFPIAHRSKTDMAEEARRLGVYDLLAMSWFCHSPWRGRPCGTCVPCRDAMVMGMSHRLPPESRLRGRAYSFPPYRWMRAAASRLLPTRS